MGKSKAHQWFLESTVVPKEQRVFVRKQFTELKKQYEFWDYLNLVFKKFQKRECYYCGIKLHITPMNHYKTKEKRDWEIDHKLAIYYGGTNAPPNLCIACRPCNRSKGAELMERNIEVVQRRRQTRDRKIAAGKVYF
jgi:5-methylcytosine-specific restriction endonuclease McrA